MYNLVRKFTIPKTPTENTIYTVEFRITKYYNRISGRKWKKRRLLGPSNHWNLATKINLKQKQVTVLKTSYDDCSPSGTLRDQLLTCIQSVVTLAFLSNIW
jgi:hypothetical protein